MTNIKDSHKTPPAPKGWYSRGYLPHADFAGTWQFITYHLADSLPAHVSQRLNSEIGSDQDAAYRKRIEDFLDAGHGECILRNQAVAEIVIGAWQFYNGRRYDLEAWVIMPNHVHVLIRTHDTSLGTIIHGWKSYTTKSINKALGKTGAVWHREYWDRFIRDQKHYDAVLNYIQQNPVKAGLVTSPSEWPWLHLPKGF